MPAATFLPAVRGALLLGLLGLALQSGCTAGAGVTGNGLPTPDPLPAPGLGTLTQRDISVGIASGGVRLLITPLTESMTRTAAPDTYRRLSGMAAAHRTRAAPGAVLMLVSVFSDEGGDFFPDEIGVFSKGVRFRPVRILPVTPGWSTRRMEPRETEMAVLTFAPGLDLEESLTFVYLGERDNSWALTLQRIEAERVRIRVRGPPQPREARSAPPRSATKSRSPAPRQC